MNALKRIFVRGAPSAEPPLGGDVQGIADLCADPADRCAPMDVVEAPETDELRARAQTRDMIMALDEKHQSGDVELSEDTRDSLHDLYARDPFSDHTQLEAIFLTPPNDFLCKITFEMMVYPVICSDGFTYERDAIVRAFNHSTLSPMTRNELETTPYGTLHMTLNIGLRGAIAEWRAQRSLPDLSAPERLKQALASEALGEAEVGQGNHLAAVPHFQQALELREKAFGPTDKSTLNFANKFATMLQEGGMVSEAEPLCRRVLEGSDATLGPMHPGTLAAVMSLGLLTSRQGKLEEAESLYRRALEGSEATHASLVHPHTLISVGNLAILLQDQGKLDEAEPLCRRALKGFETTLGPLDPSTLTAVNNLGRLLKARSKLDEAEPLYRRALEGFETTRGPTHPDTLVAVGNLGVLLKAQGKLEEAEPLYWRAIEGSAATLGAMHRNTINGRGNLGALMMMISGKEAEGLKMVRAELAALTSPPHSLLPSHRWIVKFRDIVDDAAL